MGNGENITGFAVREIAVLWRLVPSEQVENYGSVIVPDRDKTAFGSHPRRGLSISYDRIGRCQAVAGPAVHRARRLSKVMARIGPIRVQ